MTAALLRSKRPIVLITFIAFTIFAGGTFMLHMAPPAAKDKIADGLLADFLVTFPVLYYFIIVRRLKTSARSILLMVTVGCAIAYLVLPQHQRGYILQIRKLTSLVELTFIIYAVTKFNKIRIAYKIHQLHFTDPVYNLRSAMADVMGESFLVKVIASELAVLRYGLLFWKREKSLSPEYTSFSTHKESGYVAIWCILLVAVTVEVIAFHLLLMRWSNTAATIVTILSLYGVIFMIADLSALIKRKVLLNGDQIILRAGLRWQVNTNLSNIDSVKKITNDNHSNGACFKGGTIKSNSNLLITFKQPVEVEKLYGQSKKFDSILMCVDDFEGFECCCREIMQRQSLGSIRNYNIKKGMILKPCPLIFIQQKPLSFRL
jgi:hypothetical protein